jgi:hypothetical protein
VFPTEIIRAGFHLACRILVFVNTSTHGGYWVRARADDPPSTRPAPTAREPKWVRASVKTPAVARPRAARDDESDLPRTWLVDSFDLPTPRR